MNLPTNVRYTHDHEWARIDGDLLTVGITDFAQGELGDIVYVELDMLDQGLDKGAVFGTIEAVKAVSELYMPVGGTIVAVNEQLQDDPELVNNDPYGAGWMVKIKPLNMNDYHKLLDASGYQALL